VTRATAAGCAPALLGALDFGFLVVAGPAIAVELDLGSAYAWLFSAGSLAYGAVVMPAEKLLGRVSASRLLAAGLALAAAGIALVAAAGDVASVLAGRVMFGAGTGAAAAPALVLLAGEDDASFARMGGAIALGFSTGILLGTLDRWRAALVAVAAIVVALAAATATVSGERPLSPGRAAGALRLGAATAAAGASFALAGADARAGAMALAVAAVLAASAWHAVRPRVPGGAVLVACAAGAATTMSGVSAMVLLGLELSGTPSRADDVVLALFGLGTLGAVGAARRLERRFGALGTAAIGLAAQALAIFTVALVTPAVALFGAAHVVANAGAAAAVMRHAGATAAGLYATGQYVAAGAGPLLVLRSGASGMALAGAIALAGAGVVAACQRWPLSHSTRRSP
jgi:MFS family permease